MFSHIRKIILAASCYAFYIAVPSLFILSSAQAADSPLLEDSIDIYYGQLTGTSGEYVYDADGSGSGIPGYKVSELQWQLNSVPMVGVDIGVGINEKTRLNVDYRVNAADGDGTMDDYDWLYIGAPWSHWSHHSNTNVREVTHLDVNAEYLFHDFNKGKSKVLAILGYRQDHFDWQSRGGYGIYSTMGGGFRDLYLTFPDTPGISYEQTFSTPYVGIGYESTNTAEGVKITANMSLRYSQWAKGEDVDIHHLRDLRFEEEGDGGEWLGFDLSLGFHVTNRMLIKLAYSRQDYREIKASTTVTNLLTNAKTYFPGDAAGLDHFSELTSLGLVYQF